MELVKQYWYVIVAIFVFFMFYEQAGSAITLGSTLVYLCVDGIIFLRIIKKTGSRTEAKVIGYETDHDGDKTPVLEFKTSEGNIIEGKPYISISANLSGFRLNSKKKYIPVPILYLPNDPNKFVIENSEGSNYGALVFFIIAGAALAIFGICELAGIIDVF